MLVDFVSGVALIQIIKSLILKGGVYPGLPLKQGLNLLGEAQLKSVDLHHRKPGLDATL